MNTELIYRNYKGYIRQKILFILIVSLMLVIFIVAGITIGSAHIGINDLLSVFEGKGTNKFSQIIWNIRLPRVLSAVIAGTALSVSGATMQCILRNPLASPVSLGISHAAAFGAAFAIIVFGAGSTHSGTTGMVMINNPYIITVSAFFFSLISTGFILFLAKYRSATPTTIILSGIIAGSLFMAGTSMLQYFADDVQLSSIIFWMFGDLGKAGWNDFYILLIIVIPSLIYFIYHRWNYNVMNSGDETAVSLGVNVERIRVTGMLVASLAAAIAVSFFGIIAFVGLVVPHIVRRFTGSDERFLIPASALFGGMFLLLSDTIARTVLSPVVLPVGILTSFMGAPLFIYLLMKGLRS